MIIIELSGRCRQSPTVLGEEGQSLGTKDTLSIGPLDTQCSHVFINPEIGSQEGDYYHFVFSSFLQAYSRTVLGPTYSMV